MTSSIETILVLAAYFAFVVVLALAFKEYALAEFVFEKTLFMQREYARTCFFENFFVLSLHNVAASFPLTCVRAIEGGEFA